MSKCGYQWNAPYVTHPGAIVVIQGFGRIKDPGYRPQVCALEKGHQGPHRSNTNVITPALIEGRG